MVESQPSKLLVAGSIPVSRSMSPWTYPTLSFPPLRMLVVDLRFYVKKETNRRCGSYFARIASRRADASFDIYGPLLNGIFSSFI